MLNLVLALMGQVPEAVAPTPPPVTAFQLACVEAGGAIGALNMSPPTNSGGAGFWGVPLYDGPLAQITVSLRSSVTGRLTNVNGNNPSWFAELYDSYGRTVERSGPIYLVLNRPNDRPIQAEWCVFVRPPLR